MLHVIQFVCCYFFYHFVRFFWCRNIFSLYKNYYYLFIYPISLLLILLLFSYDIFLFNFLLFVFSNMLLLLRMRHFQKHGMLLFMQWIWLSPSLYVFLHVIILLLPQNMLLHICMLLLIVYVFVGRMYILLFMNSIKIQSIATTKTTTKT